MAKQVAEDGISGYQIQSYGHELTSTGQHVPRYFSQPLFKHPPVFTFLLAFMGRFFGVHAVPFIPIGAGVLLIPLVYLIGRETAGHNVGLAAAVLMWLDPVNGISSQKIWMDTTIAFFSTLALLFFILGLKRQKNMYYVLGGVAAGLAANTKYTGILIILAVCLFSLFRQRELWKNKWFIFSLVLPFLMLLPWGFWNFSVYGSKFISTQITIHSGLKRVVDEFRAGIPLLISIFFFFAGIMGIFFKLKKEDFFKSKIVSPKDQGSNRRILYKISAGFILFFFILLRDHFLKSFSLFSIPTSSMRMGFFQNEPSYFYFGRLIEYSFFYFFGLAALFLYQPKEFPGLGLLRFAALIILLFFIIWGNFQCRYILSAIPFLAVLSAMTLFRTLDFFDRRRLDSLRFLLVLLVILGVTKLLLLQSVMVFPNFMCYF